MSITTAKIARLLEPGINAVFGDYDTYPDQWKDVFKTSTSERAAESDLEMRYLGAASEKTEMGPIAVDSMSERVQTTYRHRRIALSFEISRDSLEDNLYKTEFPQQALSLRNSLRTTKNIIAASVLNNAFNTAFPVGDGKPLCAVDHPIDGGSYANTLATGTDLSEAGLEDAVIAIQSFVMQSGILCQTMAEMLYVPRNRQFDASRLINSTFRPEVANNDINAIAFGQYLPKGFKVSQYLDSQTNWFVLTDAWGLRHFQRKPVETDTYANFSTQSVSASATERYSFGCSNPRAIFGVQAVV